MSVRCFLNVFRVAYSTTVERDSMVDVDCGAAELVDCCVVYRNKYEVAYLIILPRR